MLRMLLGSASTFAVIAMIAGSGASAADLAAKKRCTDLVDFYDRWGATRTPDNSDGARNHRRIGAAIECERGTYAVGISEMEELLIDKGFEVPVDVGQAPMFFPDENEAQALGPG